MIKGGAAASSVRVTQKDALSPLSYYFNVRGSSMTILFGDPTGSPFAHHAALAHFEAGQLDAFCVPWMPSRATLRVLEQVRPLRAAADRLSRRHFSPLADVPKVQGRMGELKRLTIRALGMSHGNLPNEANEWLMRTMARECRRFHQSVHEGMILPVILRLHILGGLGRRRDAADQI